MTRDVLMLVTYDDVVAVFVEVTMGVKTDETRYNVTMTGVTVGANHV